MRASIFEEAAPVEIKVLRQGDEDVLANVGPDVFDDPIDPRAAREFLADARHHLVVAVEDGVVVGFASGVHYVHPDKPAPELWINEVGVASGHQRQGIGRAVLDALLQVGRDRGCSLAWVGTERENHAAQGLYAKSGGVEDTHDSVLFTFHLD